MNRRVLLATRHCYFDDSNGAAIASRNLMQTLARRGLAVEVLTSPLLDLDVEVKAAEWLSGRGWTVESIADQTFSIDARGLHPSSPPCVRVHARGVPVTMALGAPGRGDTTGDLEHVEFLQLFETIMRRFAPDVVLGYGGDRTHRSLLGLARSMGAKTVFMLHNCKYRDGAAFADADRVVVPSSFAARFYRQTLGLEAEVLPIPVDVERIRCDRRDPVYATFVNPSFEKGLLVFARIADEVGKRRPDIPFLVVESIGTEADIAACGLDLRGHGTVFLMGHTPDPRLFYSVSRVVLMPSLVAESFGLVAAEAMCNGIPVLSSDRGALPETLGSSGFVLPLPDRLTADGPMPTAEDVEPWVATLLRIWDEPDLLEDLRSRAVVESSRWTEDVATACHEDFFRTL